MSRKLHNRLFKYFQDFDILITPTTPIYAFGLVLWTPEKIAGRPTSPLTFVSFTYPFNMTGFPAASIPCGFSSEGTPIGMQIIGMKYDELTVLQAAKAFQEIAPWQGKRPNLN